MLRDDVLDILSRHQAELRAMGVKSLAVFGSVARNEARPDSDVDLLVDLDRPIGIFGLLEVQYRLEEILGVKVDLVTRPGVHPALRDHILSEAVSAF